MIAILPKEFTTTYNSIPVEPYSNFNKMLGYVKDSIRIYDGKIYKSLTAINPMATYNWYNEDINNIYGYDNNLEQNIQDPTNVYITSGVTVVWVQSNSKYYIANTTGYVNFTTEATGSPTNFTDLGTSAPYRHSLIYPNGKEDTLYWGYEGFTNASRMFNKILNSASTNDRKVSTNTISFTASTNTISSTSKFTDFYANDKILIDGSASNNGEFTINTMAADKLSFTVKETGILVNESAGATVSIYTYTYIKFNEMGINRIAIVNTVCDEVVIKVDNGLDIIYFNINMIDTSNIFDFYTFCFEEATQLTKFLQVVTPDFSVEFEITFKGRTQSIGEVIIGASINMERTIDDVKLDTSSFNNITEASNGDLYLPDSEQLTITSTVFTNVFPTSFANYIYNKLNLMTNKLIVIDANKDDDQKLSYLINYGYFTTHTLNPQTTAEQSTFQINFRSVL